MSASSIGRGGFGLVRLLLAGALVFLAFLVGMPLLVIVASAGLGGADTPSAQADQDIPPEMLALYQKAAQTCSGLPWSVLAAIGALESDHGRSRLPGVRSGANSAGAMGPMQFLSTTWRAYGADGSGDGIANVYDPADAVYGAANYLCALGAGDPAARDRAIWGYNHDWGYVSRVDALAREYAQGPTTAPPASVVVGLLDENGAGAQVAAYALTFLGVPYVWGGADPSGFDCSGLVQYVYAHFGIPIDHYSVSQFQKLPRVPPGMALEPGDIVFFRGSPSQPPPAHEGLYLGGDVFVQAPQRGDVVKVSPLAGRSDYMGAARPLQLASGPLGAP